MSVDTEEFLASVLPSGGPYALGVLSGDFSTHWANDQDRLITVATKISGNGNDVFFAPATFTSRNRKQAEATKVRAFWLDLDTREGKPTAEYADKRDATVAVFKFLGELGLPKPTLVDSGYGVHVWWPLTEEITPDQWNPVAGLLKAACQKWGLKADPTRTADIASVMRIPGTHNYKRGGKADIRVLKSPGLCDFDLFRKALVDYVGEDYITPTERLPNTKLVLNSDLAGGMEYPPSSARAVAEHCGVVRMMRDTRGNIDEPTWYGVLGVMVHCEEGDELCHEWSDGHPAYTRRETQAKIRHALQHGPTSCEKLGEHQPSICAACPSKGKFKSPIMLGVENAPVPQAIVAPPEVVATTGVDQLVYPDGYGYGKIPGEPHPCLWFTKMEAVEDGTLQPVRNKLCDVNLYPVARIIDYRSHATMRLRMETRRGEVTEFDIESAVVAAGGKELMSSLGRHEVAVPHQHRHQMERYLTDWVNQLRDTYSKTPAVSQFGWVDDERLAIGDTLITPEGPRPAMVTGGASLLAKHLEPKGSLQAWVEAVDKAYNRPHQEALQYCVLLAFASPLYALYGSKGGMVVYAHSQGSGFGKTTAQAVGMSAWGNPDELILQENNFTTNALYTRMGVMGFGLPVIVDEMTNCSNVFASELAYAASAGSGKARLSADGTPKETMNWCNITAASGNTLLSEKLAYHRSNAQAELARIFEFTLTRRSDIDPNEALPLFDTFKHNYGHAGRVYAEYLVNNREKVHDMLYRMRRMYNDRVKIEQFERFWSALHASVLTAASITNKLGLTSFDVSKLMDWTDTQVRNNRLNMRGLVHTPLEILADMIAEMWRGVIMTDLEGGVQGKTFAHVEKEPAGPITGRYVRGDTSKNQPERLYISYAAAKEYCGDRGISLREVLREASASGAVVSEGRTRSLGRGTALYAGVTGSTRVIEINPSAIRNEQEPVASKIITNVITNGGGNVQSAAVGRRHP